MSVRIDFPELDNFKEIIPWATHIKVNNLSKESIDDVFWAILTMSDKEK